jgi:hypothetical protein
MNERIRQINDRFDLNKQNLLAPRRIIKHIDLFNPFRIMNMNIRGKFECKLWQLIEQMENYKLHLVILTECKWSKNVNLNLKSG